MSKAKKDKVEIQEGHEVKEVKAVVEDTKPVRVSAEKEALIKTVEGFGISTEGLTTEELLAKVVEQFQKTNNQLAAEMATKEENSLAKYDIGFEHNIKNTDLLNRLMNMSVPPYYLHLFRDADMELTVKELWEIINHSGINPFTNVQDLFKPNANIGPAINKVRKRG